MFGRRIGESILFNEIFFSTFFIINFNLQNISLLYVQIKKQKGSIYILVQLESLKATVFDVSHQMNNALEYILKEHRYL